MTHISAPSHEAQPELTEALAFSVIGIAIGLALIAAKDALYGLQGSVSALATVLPFGYAYAAGMVAAVNPCGILLMPSLVAYYLGADEAVDPWQTRARKALLMGAMATIGFVVLFAAVGILFAATGRVLGAYFPIGGLAVGVVLAGLGLWMIVSGHTLGVASASRAMGAVRLTNDLRSLFVFGVGYGIASLACTLPVFLVVVGTTLAVGGILQAIGQFVGYALGMGTMLTMVIVGAAFFRTAVAQSLRRVVPYMHRLAAALLLGAGIFIVDYWLGPGGIFG